jgi:hypothetical protein
VRCGGNALSEGSGYSAVRIPRPRDQIVFSDKSAREFVIPVFPLIALAFLETRGQVAALPALCLRQPFGRLREFVWMRDLLARRQREE